MLNEQIGPSLGIVHRAVQIAGGIRIIVDPYTKSFFAIVFSFLQRLFEFAENVPRSMVLPSAPPPHSNIFHRFMLVEP
jgi:hypothetical protein